MPPSQPVASDSTVDTRCRTSDRLCNPISIKHCERVRPVVSRIAVVLKRTVLYARRLHKSCTYRHGFDSLGRLTAAPFLALAALLVGWDNTSELSGIDVSTSSPAMFPYYELEDWSRVPIRSKLKNTSNSSVVLRITGVSCGCIDTRLSKRQINPGGTAVLSGVVRVSPKSSPRVVSVNVEAKKLRHSDGYEFPLEFKVAAIDTKVFPSVISFSQTDLDAEPRSMSIAYPAKSEEIAKSISIDSVNVGQPGLLVLSVDGKEVSQSQGLWWTEYRILVEPMDGHDIDVDATYVRVMARVGTGRLANVTIPVNFNPSLSVQ